MSRRASRGRSHPFNRAEARLRVDYARRCHDAAELVGSDDSDPYAAKVAVSLYVLAGIAAADAICGAAVGERWRGDHRGAIGFLAEAIPDQAASKHLATLIDLKDVAHYSAALVDAAAEKKARRASSALIDTARQLVT